MKKTALLALLVATLIMVPLAMAVTVAAVVAPASLAAIACGTGTAQALTSSSGGGQPRPVGNPRAPLQVRVASWNTRYANSTAHVVAGIRDLARSGDVIGLQELFPAARRRQIAAAVQTDLAMTTANNAVEILWRRDRFDLVAQGDTLVFGVEPIESGTSGTTIGPKGITWVQLRARNTGATFLVVNNHLVPDIDRRGRPNPAAPRRIRLAVRQQTALTATVNQLRRFGPVFLTGDFNVDARRDATNRDPSFPHTMLGRQGLVSNWEALGYPNIGTHGRSRLIDYVWSTTESAVPVAQQIGARHGSDHHPVTVTFRNRVVASSASTYTTPPPSQFATGGDQAALLHGAGPKRPDTLTVPGQDGHDTITLSREQVSYAALAIAQAKAHSLPVDAAVVFLAAALVESGLRNLPHGDRDSIGLVQQRPSKGWGTRRQILTPKLAIDAFYGVATHTQNPGLVDIGNWRSRPLGDVAQAVQRSGFPDRYQHQETTARAIATTLAGGHDGTTAGAEYETEPPCADNGGVVATCAATGLAAERGLTPDALLVLRCGAHQFPKITTFYGIGHRSGASDHPSGRAVDLMIPNYQTSAGSAYGWQVATWMRQHAAELGVHYVIYKARIWNVDRNHEGWRAYRSTTGADNDTSLHYDHVHVSVFGTEGTGPPAAIADNTTGDDQWVMPLPTGRYRIGCSMTCYPGHTGQDFAVRSGTPVYATNGGAVVRAGQVIGLSGYTGHVTPKGESGAHLHYEIRRNGTVTDPMPILRRHGATP